MSGCAFHWTQAVWRFTQGKGLQTAFSTDPATHRYIKQLLALPYLPHQEIGPCLAELRQEASTDSLKDVCKYIIFMYIYVLSFQVCVPQDYSHQQ